MNLTRWFGRVALLSWLGALAGETAEAQSLRREVDWPSGVAADLRSREYHFSRLEGQVWSGPNRAQGLRSRVSLGGLEVFPRATDASGEGAEWKLRLRSKSFGRLGEAVPLEARSVLAHGNRVELDHGRLVEWLVNDERGIEQGWTIASRPAGPHTEPLWIGLEFGGDLVPRIAEDGRSAALVDVEGTVRLHYRDLVAWDANGHPLQARLTPGPTGPGIRVDDAGAAYPITVDPTLVLGWTAEGDQADANFGWSVAMAGDVNADGYSDVIIGARNYDRGEPNEGRAFVYLGSATGLEPSVAWSAESNQAESSFGTAVAAAGDVNGDGFSDVIVGAHLYDDQVPDQGRAYVYLGSPVGLSTSPAWTMDGDQESARFGGSVSTAGDVNGDGFADIVVGQPRFDVGIGRVLLFRGSPTGPSTEASWTVQGSHTQSYFGNSVSAAGDVNGDGYADVIVGCLFQNTGGEAYVFLGSSSGLSTIPAWVGNPGQNNARFGRSVSSAGDVNGDGYSDVIVGASFHQSGEETEGRAFVYLGSSAGLSTSPVWTAESNQRAAYFGHSVATAGDVNGDGYSDVLVGSYAFDNGELDEGRAYLYLGSESGPSLTPDWTTESDQVSAAFGVCVSAAGDVNGDGFSDIAIGAYLFDDGEEDEGRVFVYHGSGSFYGLEEEPSRIVHGDQQDAYLGYSLSAEGDVNGDGYSDLIVGAPHYDGGQENQGRAFVYLGSAGGLASLPVRTLEGEQAYDYFGWSVSIAGDVDGDGYGDVLVGSLGFDAGENNEGRAFLFPGSFSGPSSTATWTVDGDQPNAMLGSRVAGAGDVNGDGFADVLVAAIGYDDQAADEGRAWLYLGAASGLASEAAWSVGGGQDRAHLGDALATAGDVNGDGYCDVLVGAPDYDDGELDEGAAFLYLGSAFGLTSSPAWMGQGDQANASYGACAATVGDVNGDGYSDVIVGAELYDADLQDEGRAFVYLGSAAGLATLPAWTADGSEQASFFGASASTAGDVNGDGYSDVVVGAYGQDGGSEDEGRVHGYMGSALGLSPFPAWTVTSGQLDAYLGFDLSAGDVNGDGYSDVLVGAIRLDAHGGTFVYLGNEGREARIRALRQLQPDGSAPIALLGRSDARRDFLIRADVPSGPIGSTAFLEWEVKPLGAAFDGLDLRRSSAGQLVTLPALPLVFEELATTESRSARPVTWRVRVVFEGLASGRTPWFSLPGNAPTEAKLRLREPERRIRRFSGSLLTGDGRP